MEMCGSSPLGHLSKRNSKNFEEVKLLNVKVWLAWGRNSLFWHLFELKYQETSFFLSDFYFCFGACFYIKIIWLIWFFPQLLQKSFRILLFSFRFPPQGVIDHLNEHFIRFLFLAFLLMCFCVPYKKLITKEVLRSRFYATKQVNILSCCLKCSPTSLLLYIQKSTKTSHSRISMSMCSVWVQAHETEREGNLAWGEVNTLDEWTASFSESNGE